MEHGFSSCDSFNHYFFLCHLIDINDIYGDYGINDNNITIPTLLLFCFQWTLVLIPIHFIAKLSMEQHFPIKEKMLYTFLILVTVSSFIMILSRATDIKEALVMDLADVRNQHYQDLANGGSSDGANYLMLLPNIFVSNPFPTLSLFLWFYIKAFMKCNIFLRFGILTASIVQAIIAIIMAGRAAMIYWAFDFFLLYSYFYRYLKPQVRKKINLTALILGGIAGFMFIAITLARFDDSSYNRNPFDSLYGYAGQHINNFCTMIINGGETPASFDRLFPLLSKLTGHSFDLFEHYETIGAHMPSNIVVNVFDSFGAEIFLDLGWFGLSIFFMMLLLFAFIIKTKWQAVSFHRVFFMVIIIAFFSRGLFAWPFTHHYTTLAILLTLFCSYLFKYAFKI